MNEELQKALTEIVLGFANALGGAKDFALEQAPEVIQQVLLWETTMSAIGFAIGLLLIATGVVLLMRRIKWTPPPLINPADGVAKWLSDMKSSKNFNVSYHAGQLVESVKQYKIVPEADAPDELFIISSVFALLGIIVVSFNLDWFQIWIAPKVYLIEYAASLAQ